MSRTGEPAFFPEIPDELLVDAAVDDEHLALIRSIGMRSAVVVPLLVRGRSLGALTLVHAESGRRFDEVDLAFAEQLAGDRGGRAGQRPPLRGAAAHRADPAGRAAARPPARGARAAPGRPLPRRRPTTGPGCTSGGDLYDVVAGAGRAWGVVVADVCGKGPRPPR